MARKREDSDELWALKTAHSLKEEIEASDIWAAGMTRNIRCQLLCDGSSRRLVLQSVRFGLGLDRAALCAVAGKL